MMNPLMMLKAGGLRLIDWVNFKFFYPFQPFDRPVRSKDGWTLEEMYEWYDADVQKRFSKDGYFVQDITNNLGDQTVWQGYYVAYRVLRWKLNNSSENYTEAMAAIRVLMQSSDGVLVRGVAHPDFNSDMYHKDPSKNYYMRGTNTVRDDASIDSLAGWIFGMAVAKIYMSSKSLGQAGFYENLKQYAKLFKEDNYNLIKEDGSPTTYHRLTPGVFQAPLYNMLAILVLVLGDDDERLNLIDKLSNDFKYSETRFGHKRRESNDHLAIMTSLSMVMLTRNDNARKGLERLLYKFKEEGNALLVYMSRLLGVHADSDTIHKAEKTLLEFGAGTSFPNGKAPGQVNLVGVSHIPQRKWWGKDIALQPVPAWEGAPVDVRWQRGVYSLKGGEHTPYSGIDFLLAYVAKMSS